MERTFLLEQTLKTPFVSFNADNGELTIRGKSIPENTVAFYQPIFDWLNQYERNPAKKTLVNLQLDYFNTSSAKIFADFFTWLEKLHSSGKSEVHINWLYNEEDDDMLEAGEDYKSIIDVPFELKPFTK
jgi:hypothetical protein